LTIISIKVIHFFIQTNNTINCVNYAYYENNYYNLNISFILYPLANSY